MIEITTERSRMSVDAIHHYLCEESYWAAGIAREVVLRSMDHSLCFAALDGGVTVGFARVITDYATFGYIADVFVVASHRGLGISKRLMGSIHEYPSLQNLRRWQLVTRDAQALYAQFGFVELARPERHMEKVDRSSYRQPAGF